MKLFCALAVALLTAVNLAAQIAPLKESEQEESARELEQKAVALVRRAADDAAALKLPENRACVFASAANLLWRFDEKSARNLFERAVAELVQYRAESDEDDNEAIFYQDQLRRGILGLIARNDADSALKLLRETRAPAVAAILNDKDGIVKLTTTMDFGDYRSRILYAQVAGERDAEIYLTKRAIANNPAQAAKLLRAAEDKSVALAVLPALEKLRAKDLNAASDAANEILNELVAAPTINGHALDFLLLYFAGEAAKKDKPLQINRDALTKFAAKLADSYLQIPNEPQFYYVLATAIPRLERFAPAEAVQKLRVKVENLRKKLSAEQQNVESLDAYRRVDAPPEKLLADAAKMSGDAAQTLYSIALEKSLAKHDFDGARRIVQEKFPAKQRAYLLDWVRQSEINRLIAEDKLGEARANVAAIKNADQRIAFNARIALALAAKKTADSRRAALEILNEIGAAIDSTPETEEEMHRLIAVVGANAEIEPERAFALLAQPIDKFNDLLRAGSMVRRFVRNRHEFRRGEFVTGALDQNFRSYFAAQIGFLNKLAHFDFDRTTSIADRFARAEVQIVARMLIAESVLQPEPDELNRTFAIADANDRQIGFQVY